MGRPQYVAQITNGLTEASRTVTESEQKLPSILKTASQPATTRVPEVNNKMLEAAYDGNASLVRDLLRQGADPNAREGDEWTALTYAASEGHSDVVQLLISQGSNVNATVKNREFLLS